jgi:hypothetical protein
MRKFILAVVVIPMGCIIVADAVKLAVAEVCACSEGIEQLNVSIKI